MYLFLHFYNMERERGIRYVQTLLWLYEDEEQQPCL